MNWGLIPEIFFDVIGRVIPGCLLIMAAILVGLGPSRSLELILTTSSAMTISSLLLLVLCSYFVAVVMKQVWEAIRALKTSKEQVTTEIDIILHNIGRSLPAEAAKLLKIQAEKNFCEVLIAGLGVLLPIQLWLLWSGSMAYWLFWAIVLSILACWRWRGDLEELHQKSVERLRPLLPTKQHGGHSSVE